MVLEPTQWPQNPLRNNPDYQTLLQTLLQNPAAFAAYYFDFEMEPYQITLLKLAAGFPITEEEADVMDPEDFRYDWHNRKSLILLPAGHGKSTLICKVLPIFEICRNPNVRIILIMKSDNDVKKYSSSIRKILMSNEKLMRDFGPFRPPESEVWNSESINVFKRTILDEHNTIEFFGAGGTILGHRCDVLIMDDVVTEKNSLTPEMRDKYEKWFDETVATAPRYLWPRDTGGRVKVPHDVFWPENVGYERLVVCGTRFHPEDLYYKMKRDTSYNYLKYDCYRDIEEKIPLSPKLMPIERLKEEEGSSGLLSFNRRYRNEPFDESEMAFQKAWIYGGEWRGVEWPGSLDESRSFGEYDPDWYITLGFDPATGRGSRKSTWPSYVVLGTNEEYEEGDDGFKYNVIDVFRQQMGMEDQISVLLDGDSQKKIPGFYEMYRYDKALVEANSFCTWITDHRRVHDAVLNRVPISGYENQKRKEDPEMNVRKMEVAFMNGLVGIPYRTPADKLQAKELIRQLLLFPKGIHDYCMALWFAYYAAERKKAQFKSFYRPGFSGKLVKNPHFVR